MRNFLSFNQYFVKHDFFKVQVLCSNITLSFITKTISAVWAFTPSNNLNLPFPRISKELRKRYFGLFIAPYYDEFITSAICVSLPLAT